MSYTEEDAKLHRITPALQAAGWGGHHLTMEYAITAGQIVLQGDGHRQEERAGREHGPDGPGDLLAGGLLTNYVQRWNGSTWTRVGNVGQNGGIVRALTEWSGTIYAGGRFETFGGGPAPGRAHGRADRGRRPAQLHGLARRTRSRPDPRACLLYTSDAADERSSVDLGGRRIIKKKKQNHSWIQSCRVTRDETESPEQTLSIRVAAPAVQHILTDDS